MTDRLIHDNVFWTVVTNEMTRSRGDYPDTLEVRNMIGKVTMLREGTGYHVRVPACDDWIQAAAFYFAEYLNKRLDEAKEEDYSKRLTCMGD